MSVWNRLARKVLIHPVPAARFGAPRTVILCYHSIHPARSFRSASPALFAAHLGWLRENCIVVTMRGLLARRAEFAVARRPVVCVTFDDGYEDNYEHAFPLLRAHELTATFFLTTGFVERDATVLARLRELRNCTDAFQPMTWAQAREMSCAGMEIAAHTYSHANLADETPAGLARELVESKALLEKRLGEPVVGIAYPFGKPHRHFNRRVIRAVRKAGYRYAAAACFRGVKPADSPFALPRFFIASDTIETLRDKIYGGWDLLGEIQQHTPGWLSRLLSRSPY